MKTSTSNIIQPNTMVTPDLVTEIKKSKQVSKNYGLVTEIKTDLPMKRDYWRKSVKQLKKYDDKLDNWSFKISNHDIAFVTLPTRTYDFTNFLKSPKIVKDYTFERNLAVVNCTRMQQENVFMFLKKESGAFSQKQIDEKISRGVAVSQFYLLPKFEQMRFYDTKPPLIYTMMILWNHVFKNYLSAEKLRDLGRRRSISIILSIKDLVKKLKMFAPVTNPNCIDRDWIYEAMEAFREIGLAKPLESTGESFEVKIILPKEDFRDWLISKFKKMEKEKAGRLDRFFPK